MNMRSLLLAPLFRSILSLPGVGPKVAPIISRLTGGEHVLDMLYHMPVDMVDRRYCPKISTAENGKICTLEVEVVKHIPNPRRSAPYRIECIDETGKVVLIFFHARKPWLEAQFPLNETILVTGKLDRNYGHAVADTAERNYRIPQMAHPERLDTSDESAVEWTEPIYPMTQGLSPKTFRKAMLKAFEGVPKLPEWLPDDILKRHKWKGWGESLKDVHHPESFRDIDALGALRMRLAFDELLAQQLALRMVRNAMKRPVGQSYTPKGDLRARVLEAFPYSLTGAQKRALQEIDADMVSAQKMLRLLQGDVGSGKTIVALAAACNVIECGAQAAIMAPTEILARQHYESIVPLAKAAGISCAILTGRDKGKAREGILRRIDGTDIEGQADLIIGTHALFQNDVQYNNLGLVVIDEQHRFGVQQRLMLSEKGVNTDVLVMTATPIPRSLSLTVYGDMDSSRLDEKPAGRKPIDTRLISLERLGNVIDGLQRKSEEGERAYWVCPLIEESEKLDLAAAEDRYLLLQQFFGDRVGLVHGKMKPADKDAVMARFVAGELDVLIATTVIEVGVNVPEATVMVIEHAERFGLSQLHQLRGRVGRGDKPSSCLLLYSEKLGQVAKERLSIMRETEDGFVISEKDLDIRGAGDMLGTAQSGLPRYKCADLDHHGDLLYEARQYADYILAQDPTLKGKKGEALRILLYLFEKDKAISYLRSG